MKQPRIQFGLSDALLGVAAFCVLFACIALAGTLGGVLFIGACGITLLLIAVLLRNSRYVFPGVVLTILGVFALVLGSMGVAGSGTRTLPFTVRVLDEFGKPVAGATVRLGEMTPSVYEKDVCGKTDATGNVTLHGEFMSSFNETFFLTKSSVSFFDLRIQVDAPGYEREIFLMETVTGPHYDCDDLPLPTGRVQLTRVRK